MQGPLSLAADMPAHWRLAATCPMSGCEQSQQ